MRRRQVCVPRRERGVALVVALIIVAIAAVMSLARMQAASMQASLTTNEDMARTSHAVADSVAGAVLESLEPKNIPTGVATRILAPSPDERIAVEVTARQEGAAALYGSSLRRFGFALHAVKVTATSADSSARRTVTIGAGRRIPLL